MSRIRVLSGKRPIYTNIDINRNTMISYIFLDFLIYVPIDFPMFLSPDHFSYILYMCCLYTFGGEGGLLLGSFQVVGPPPKG